MLCLGVDAWVGLKLGGGVPPFKDCSGLKEFLQWIGWESKRSWLKFGRPHWQQIQVADEFERAVKTWEFILRHLLWYQVSQVSHWIAAWFDLQGREQSPQGNLKFGPGFNSRSPERSSKEKSRSEWEWVLWVGRLDIRDDVEKDLETIFEQNNKEWELTGLVLLTTTVEDGVILDSLVRKKETV